MRYSAIPLALVLLAGCASDAKIEREHDEYVLFSEMAVSWLDAKIEEASDPQLEHYLRVLRTRCGLELAAEGLLFGLPQPPLAELDEVVASWRSTLIDVRRSLEERGREAREANVVAAK